MLLLKTESGTRDHPNERDKKNQRDDLFRSQPRADCFEPFHEEKFISSAHCPIRNVEEPVPCRFGGKHPPDLRCTRPPIRGSEMRQRRPTLRRSTCANRM